MSRGEEKLLLVGFELVSTSAGDLNAHTHRRRGSRRDIKTQSISVPTVFFPLYIIIAPIARAPPVYYTVTTLYVCDDDIAARSTG